MGLNSIPKHGVEPTLSFKVLKNISEMQRGSSSASHIVYVEKNYTLFTDRVECKVYNIFLPFYLRNSITHL